MRRRSPRTNARGCGRGSDWPGTERAGARRRRAGERRAGHPRAGRPVRTGRSVHAETSVHAERSVRSSNSPSAGRPLDSYEPNGFGLYNTSGNVWEWCADAFTAPSGTSAGGFRCAWDVREG
ncbi:SUMF1/EgtB/PvdO family nonheme iron enzyme [Streptomyces mirabilis]|uniref:SUMF1/EgtB/PvdO family nonheme iron enzyme n=1 Tax=Streptomyces mirabilis TaxID=68239 RepID=UPI003D9EE2AF